MRKIITAVILALGTAFGSLGIVSAVPASASGSRTYVYAAGTHTCTVTISMGCLS